MAGEIVGAARRLDRVVENLLDVSRLDKGTLQPRREWFELDELLSLVRSQMAEETKGRLLRITGDTEVLLEGDFRLLEHAISQIVLNAVKYGRPGTDISVTATSEANHLRVVVRDEGPGLAAGSEAQVFEKFYRAPGIPAGGLGLGLSIVKSIVELHGGTVAARNRSDGMGAEFEIVLPLVPPPPELKEVVG